MPQCFNVVVVEGYVGVLQIDPIAHPDGQVVPQILVFHHLLTAGMVVVVNGNLFADILFCYAEVFLHAKFNRKSVGVPAGLALHQKALLRLVAAENVLQGTRHHVVDARFAVCGRGAFVKNEWGVPFTDVSAFAESPVLFPELQYLFRGFNQVKILVFRIFLFH